MELPWSKTGQKQIIDRMIETGVAPEIFTKEQGQHILFKGCVLVTHRNLSANECDWAICIPNVPFRESLESVKVL